VGGGITGRKEAEGAFNAGADLVVVGNAVERNPEVIVEIAQAKSLFSA
jgi:putative glycerol-1-phosphate prenyltransferase